MGNARRVAVGGILTECNHFGGLPIDMAVYESYELLRGEELRTLTTSVVGGMLDGLTGDEALEIEAVPLLYASACAAGPITTECYEALRDELLGRLEAAMPVDAVLLPLHGAALADDCDDPEGDIIQRVRELVGPEIPVVVTDDLHAHITQQMVQYSDAILGWETYPHYDQYQTGQRAAELLKKMLKGECRPTMAMAKVPVVTSAVHGSTNDVDPFADLMRFTKSLENQPEVLSTSLFLIHPYMDVPNMGSGGLVITDNDMELAKALAEKIGMRYWDRRHDLEPEIYSPQQAIELGMEIEGGPVILVEAADCCGGGAAGDSIATLNALVDRCPDASALVIVVDPEAAEACHQVELGSELTLEFGHRLVPKWGRPREFTGRLERLSDGKFVYTGGQWEGKHADMGPTAVFSIGSIKVVLCSIATYDWADEQYRSLDLDPTQAKFIVAKNPMNYRWAYGKVMKARYFLDTPGPTPATLRNHRFQRLQRPFFPADVDIEGLKPTILF